MSFQFILPICTVKISYFLFYLLVLVSLAGPFNNCIPEYINTNLLDKNHRRKVRIVNRQVCRELLCSMLCLRVGGRHTYKRGFLNLVTKYCHVGFSLLLSEMGLVFDIGYKGGSACECEKGSQKLPNLKIWKTSWKLVAPRFRYERLSSNLM